MTNSKKRCKSCREYFPFEDMQMYPIGAVCGSDCLTTLINEGYVKNAERAKKQVTKLINSKIKEDNQIFAKKKREFKLNDKTLRKKAAQSAFNKFIRLRDEKLPCISCQRFHTGQWHGGHYKTTGAFPELRFNEDNCHKQCAPCNNHLSGNIEHYRPNLIEKIGRKAFDRLEGPHPIKKYGPDDYKKVEDYYKAKLKLMD